MLSIMAREERVVVIDLQRCSLALSRTRDAAHAGMRAIPHPLHEESFIEHHWCKNSRFRSPPSSTWTPTWPLVWYEYDM